MALNEDEVARYARHIVLKDIGGPGQQKLKAAKALVIGAGGLGSPCALYLAAAGVGTIGLIDDDLVSLSNLQRQVLHTTKSVGTLKVESAAGALSELNPHVEVRPYPFRLTGENALEIISGYDIVADGCDNFGTRLLVNDACYFTKTPLVSAAVGQFDGQLSTFRAFEAGPDGAPNPSYRCLVPEAPPPGAIATCEEAGVLGALTGVMGSLQALEVIKEITGAGTSLTGKLLIYDALETLFRTVKLRWDPDNPLNGRAPTITDLSGH